MPSIEILDRSVYELIAAGEVIEKPASVIKETIENSIDAGAKHITIEIKCGGIEFMRVADDGCGIAAEDVPKAFIRHATSKIASKNDLDNIMTLGFRGEALASVAAVSNVTLLTKRRSDEFGTCYKINGSVEESIENTGCPDGTTIIIKNLFYNVPARKKFLKKEVTEANAVGFIVRKVALSHPEISFKFIRENRLEFCSSGDGNLKSAIYSVYGKDFSNDMIPVEYEIDSVKISGCTIKPLYAKSNRSFQNFFVDKRYVTSKICSAALENAYENLIMTGRFPACVINISMPPDMLDVNIHPTKAQVRFSDEKKISDAVYFAVKNALMNANFIYDFKLPEAEPYRQWKENAVGKNTDFVQMNLKEKTEKSFLSEKKDADEVIHVLDKSDNTEEDIIIDIPKKETDEKISERDDTNLHISDRLRETIKENKEQSFEMHITEDASFKKTDDRERTAGYEESPDMQRVPGETASPEKIYTEKNEAKNKNIIVIGEAFKNYIIAQTDNDLIIIDKHAAHERVLFEKLKKGAGKLDQQYLLNPVKMLLSADEYNALETNKEKLDDLGFIFSFDNKPFAVLKAVPIFMADLDFEEVISEISNNLMMCKKNPQTHYFDDMLHTMACKAAIKANDNNLTLELQYLADEIFDDRSIRHCPHGRPVMFKISEYDLEKQFKRTGV